MHFARLWRSRIARRADSDPRAAAIAGLTAIALLTGLPTGAAASGHGPVFGWATPTLGQGGWAIDQAWMCRAAEDGDSDQLLRTMFSFGVTEDVQVSASLPVLVTSSGHMPTGRMMAMMSGHRELEGLVAWRFHRQSVGPGARFESTAYAGVTVPLQNQHAGMFTSPSASLALATGYASRAHYVWVGGGYQRYGANSSDQLGSVTSFSAVYGYRPAVLRLDYPKPDLRFFVEAVAERTGPARHTGTAAEDPGSHHSSGNDVPLQPAHAGPGGGDVILVGPTVLLCYTGLTVLRVASSFPYRSACGSDNRRSASGWPLTLPFFSGRTRP